MDAYAFFRGSFGHAVVLELKGDLVEHAHSETQFAFWLGGTRAIAHVGNHLVKYGENVALGTNAYEAHDTRLVEDEGLAIFLVLYIDQKWLDARRAKTGHSFFFASPSVPIDDATREACWRVLDIMVSPDDSARDKIDTEVEGLLEAAINSTLAPAPVNSPRHRVRVLDSRLRAAIAFMRENVSEPLSVEEVASKVGLSRAHFYSLFRSQLNTTPQVFWSAIRVEEAVARLTSGEDSVTAMALDLGFSSPGNFSRFFKEHMGISPSRFRRITSNSTHPLTGVN